MDFFFYSNTTVGRRIGIILFGTEKKSNDDTI